MDVLIVEDDQEQLDGIESILLEKYDHMNTDSFHAAVCKNTNPVSDCIFHGCTTCNTCNELL